LLSAACLKAGDCNTDCDTSGTSGRRARSTIVQHPHHDLLEHQNHYRNYVYGEDDCFNLKFNVTYQFDKTFNEDENLTCALFGRAAQSGQTGQSSSSNVSSNACNNNSVCQSILLQGNNISGGPSARDNNALLAEQFGLGPDTNAQVNFNPEIKNHLFNFQMHMNMGELLEGLYMQVDLPLVRSKWNLCGGDDNCTNLISSGSAAGTEPHLAGCMDAYSEGPVSPVSSIQQALAGQTNFGDKTTNLAWDSIECGEKNDTKLANLTFALGYNFWECPDYHMGAYLYYAAPTGTDIGSTDQDNARHLFAPVIGSDHHELGAGLNGHFEIYNWDDEHTFTAYMQGYAAHGFDEQSRRTFDLSSQGDLSRYMLLKEFDSNDNYNGNLIQAANVTTQCVETSIDIKGEGIIEFMYSNACGLDVSLGYAIWGQGSEDLENCREGLSIGNKRVGVKGCAPIEGIQFARTNQGDQQTNGNVQGNGTYNGTQSNATIFSCPSRQNAADNNNLRGRPYRNPDRDAGDFRGTAPDYNVTDPCIDDRVIENGDNIENYSLLREVNGPSLLSGSDIDQNSGLIPSMLSHRIFGRINYTFEDCDFTPYVSIGGFVEFSDSSHPATAERGGFFINGGISF